MMMEAAASCLHDNWWAAFGHRPAAVESMMVAGEAASQALKILIVQAACPKANTQHKIRQIRWCHDIQIIDL